MLTTKSRRSVVRSVASTGAAESANHCRLEPAPGGTKSRPQISSSEEATWHQDGKGMAAPIGVAVTTMRPTRRRSRRASLSGRDLH